MSLGDNKCLRAKWKLNQSYEDVERKAKKMLKR